MKRSGEVARIAGVSAIRARQWAKQNGVEFDAYGYRWSDADVSRFLNRRKANGKS